MGQLLEITQKGGRKNIVEMIILRYVSKNFPQVLLDMIFEYVHISWYKLYTSDIKIGTLIAPLPNFLYKICKVPLDVKYFRTDKWNIKNIINMKLLFDYEKIIQCDNIIDIKDHRIDHGPWDTPYVKIMDDKNFNSFLKLRINEKRSKFAHNTHIIRYRISSKIIPKHLYLIKKYGYLGLIGYELERELQIKKNEWMQGLIPIQMHILGNDKLVIDS